MANRRPQNSGGRRMDFGRNDRIKTFGNRNNVSPWQGGSGPGGMNNLLPLGAGSTDALALASNIINLLQPQRPNAVPSLLDMPIRRDFVPNMGRFDRGYGTPNRMGNQGNFRRTGNYNRAGERIYTNQTNRKPFRSNDGPKPHVKSSPKKEADSKAEPVKESEQEEQKDTDNKDSDGPKTQYDDINSQLLKCHICNKSMWDGRSFKNHLNGRAHAIMMQKTAESYMLTADTMRQEFKIREMKRTRKSGQQPARDFYCAMCDMYAADGAAHRTTVGHRKLKKYLHPSCTSCHKEMPTRIELDEHRLTAEHLRNIQDKQDVLTKPKQEVMVISTLGMEQVYVRDDKQRRRRSDVKQEKNEEEEDKEGQEDVEAEGEAKEVTEDGNTEAATEEEKPSVDNENTILDYVEGDDLTNVTPDMYPEYSTSRGVGQSFISEFTCYECRLCRKLLDSADTAAVHLRTWRHHQLFTRHLQQQQKKPEEAEPEPEEAGPETEEAEPETEEAEPESNKRPIEQDDNNEDGNWKRRKTHPDVNGHEDVEMKEEHESENNVETGEAMPSADDLEDWGNSDEVPAEDNADNGEEVPAVEEKMQEVEKKEPVEKTEPSPAPSPAKVTRTPRGRGRGRRRY